MKSRRYIDCLSLKAIPFLNFVPLIYLKASFQNAFEKNIQM